MKFSCTLHITVCRSCGVWKLRCVGVLVCRSCGVWELVCGSCGVCRSLCVGVAVFGGRSLGGFGVGLCDVYRFEL